jgi:putative ABC transport system permease protein
MWKTTLASIRGHKRRLLATSSAVLLGVAFLTGTLVFGDTTSRAFGDLFDEANAGTDALVRSSIDIGTDGPTQTGLLDEALADEIAGLDGVAAAAPVVERAGQLVGSDGDPLGGQGPPTLAGNWITDERLNPYSIVEGRAPEAGREIVIDRESADDGDLAVGDTTTIRLPDPVEVTVVGVATFGEGGAATDSMAGTTFAGFTTEAAQELLLPRPDQITQVLVAAEDGVSEAALVERIRPMLPDDTEAITGAALVEEQKDDIESDFLGFFRTALVVFAGIALVVATFSIYNTFSIVVAQRTRESALLRALGASRRQVLGSVVVEAVIVGLLASVIGIVAGVLVAQGLGALTAGMGLDMPSTDFVLATGTVVTALVVGVVVTLLAAVAPAVKASRVPPLAALRDVAIDRSAASRGRAVVGLVLTGGGVALTVAGATGGSMGPTGLGALVVLVGVVLLGPVAARPVASLLGTPLSALRGMSGRLARRNAMRNPRRTASTASALMVGVAVVVMFTVMAASLKTYIDEVTDRAFAGDLVISAEGSFSGIGLSPQLAGAIAEVPEVETATSLGDAVIRVDGEDEWASSINGPAMDRIMDLDEAEGSITEVVGHTVAVSQPYAEDHGWSVGDTVPVAFADGARQDLRLVAVYESRDLFGDVLVSHETWEPHALQRQDFVVFVDVADGADLARAETAIQAVADRFHAPDVQTREEYVDTVAGEVDQMLAVIYALLALAIVIALMGIANTLSLSVHERTRELGLLRAVGQSRRQLRTMVRGEASVVALFGTVGGVGLGCFLGWALIRALSAAELDGSQPFAIPAGQLAVILVLGAVVGLVAALRPARRAARLDVLEAIATE